MLKVGPARHAAIPSILKTLNIVIFSATINVISIKLHEVTEPYFHTTSNDFDHFSLNIS